jgi:hypothetical protein
MVSEAARPVYCAQDLDDTIRFLKSEKEKLEQAIAALDALKEGILNRTESFGDVRRGRKSMGAAERAEVSRRMKRYWANRRTRGA